MAAKKKTTKKRTSRKPARKQPRKRVEVKLSQEQFDKLTDEFSTSGVASLEVPSSAGAYIKMQRS